MTSWRAWFAALAALALLSLPGGPAAATRPPPSGPPDPVGHYWVRIKESAGACDLKARKRGVFGQVNIRFNGPTRFEKRASANLSADLVACVTHAAEGVIRDGEHFPWRLRKTGPMAEYGDQTHDSVLLGEPRLVLPDAARWVDDWRVLADVMTPAARRTKARHAVGRLLPSDIAIDAKSCLRSPFYVIQNLTEEWIRKTAKSVTYNWLALLPSGKQYWVLARDLVVSSDGYAICPLPLTDALKRQLRAKMDAAGSCWQGEVGDLLVEPHASLPRDRRYRWAAVAGKRACGVDEAGAIVCCGSPLPAPPPPGRFTRIEMIAPYSCALREDQTAVCWPEPGTATMVPTFTDRYTELSLAPTAGCAKRVDGGFTCWGQPVPPDDVTKAAREISLDPSGWTGYAVLRRDGSLVWGPTATGDINEGPRDLVMVRRNDTLCALTGGGEVLCRGMRDSGAQWALASRERFHDIANMGITGCGRRRDDTLECWGGSTPTSPLRVPAGQFRQIAADTGQVCGVRVDGTVACAGYRGDWIVFE